MSPERPDSSILKMLWEKKSIIRGESDMKRKSIIFFFVPTVFAFTACATFLDLEKKETLKSQTSVSTKKNLTITYAQYQQVDTEKTKSPEKDRLITEQRIIKILNRSNQFTEVKVAENENSPAASDLTMKFTVVSNVNNKIGPLRILSFVTLGVVPMQFKQETKLTSEVFDKNGKRLKLTESSFQSDTWIGWIFLPLAPFFWPDSQADKAFENMVGSTLAEMKKENLL